MKKHHVNITHITALIFIFLLTSLSLSAQAPAGTVKGTVKDAAGTPLARASVLAGKTGKGTSTDENGNFSLSLPAGTYELTITLIGHAPQTIPVTITAGSTISQDITLVTNSAEQETVLVVGSRNPRRTATESPVPVDEIPLKQISTEVGQLDVTQLLTFLAPSFNSVRQALGDGTDHIDPAQLRGLGPDQVLVLVNGKRYHQSSLVNVNGTVNKIGRAHV